MPCPTCDARFGEDEVQVEELHLCPDCGVVSIGASELNRVLLHNGLPGIESLGGRRVRDAVTETCRACRVDLSRFEAADRGDPRYYDICEECGRVCVSGDDAPAGEPEVALRELVTFFRAFAGKRARAR